MSQAQTTTPFVTAPFQDGTQIPELLRCEAMAISAEELERFLELIESLSAEDWNRQTACTLWTVKDVVAHQAAHVSGFVSLRSFMSQLNPAMLRPYLKNGMSMLDAWNQSQVDLRRDSSPSELISEIRSKLQRSLSGRNRIPAMIRAPVLPMPGLDQPRSMAYVFDLIYTRDMWMHRIDIATAVGRRIAFDDHHDRRMVALIVRDLAIKAARGLQGRAALLRLKGPAGGTYRIGANTQPSAVLEMDILTFSALTSGRETAERILSGGSVQISGDIAFGEAVVNFSDNRVLY
jgi:uncharacterized protein (TIGR03083 family)